MAKVKVSRKKIEIKFSKPSESVNLLKAVGFEQIPASTQQSGPTTLAGDSAAPLVCGCGISSEKCKGILDCFYTRCP